VSGCGVSWAVCKSAPRSRQITKPVPDRSDFYRPGALPVAQPTVSKHWRQTRTQTPNPIMSFKSRLVLPFWNWFIQVVLEKWPLNGCCSSSCILSRSGRRWSRRTSDSWRWRHRKTTTSRICFAKTIRRRAANLRRIMRSERDSDQNASRPKLSTSA